MLLHSGEKMWYQVAGGFSVREDVECFQIKPGLPEQLVEKSELQ